MNDARKDLSLPSTVRRISLSLGPVAANLFCVQIHSSQSLDPVDETEPANTIVVHISALLGYCSIIVKPVLLKD